jgi:hypothetical protein
VWRDRMLGGSKIAASNVIPMPEKHCQGVSSGLANTSVVVHGA